MEEKNKRQQLIVRITCFIAAFGLWLYISNIENPIGTYKLTNVPVKLINVESLYQSKLALLPGNQPTVTVTLRGTASDFSSVKPEQFNLVADMGAYVVKKGENHIPVQVVESPNPDNIKVVNSDNLWVKVNLDDYVEKTVPIKLNIGDAKQGYYPLQPQLRITDIMISGAAKYVSMVDNVIAKCDLKNYTKDISVTLPLQAINSTNNVVVNDVKLSSEFIDVTIPIKKVKTVGINIKTTGTLNKNIILKSLTSVPDKIDIAGDDNVIKNITNVDTQPIDLQKLQENTSLTVPLVLPSGIIGVNSDGSIKVTANMDKNTEKNLSIDISVKNAGSDLDYTLGDTKVALDITGLESIVNNLKPEDITCSVDLNSLAEGDYNLPVNITLPEGVTKVSSAPEVVKVSLKKKG
jgi:YbbR domain-containing protein